MEETWMDRHQGRWMETQIDKQTEKTRMDRYMKTRMDGWRRQVWMDGRGRLGETNEENQDG